MNPRASRFFVLNVLLCLLALIGQGMVPAGFMPNRERDAGMPAIVICTPDGLQTLDGTSDGGSAGGHPDNPCAYSVLPAAMTAAVVPALAVPVAPVLAALAAAPDFSRDERAQRTVFAHGPPALS